MSAFRKPAAWMEKRLDSWTKTALTPPELRAGLGARTRHPTHASPRGRCSLSHPITTDKNSVQQLEIPAPNATGVCFPNSLSPLHPTAPKRSSLPAPPPLPRAGKITATGARVSYGKVTGRFITGRSPDALPWVPPALSTPLAAVRQAESSSCLQILITDASEPPRSSGGAGRDKGNL